MEKIKKNKKIILGILIAIILIAGIAITLTIGLNFDLKYQETKQIQLNLGTEFETKDIKEITDEVFPGQKVMIQKVEVFNDAVSIITTNITDEQKQSLIDKVNEKYESAEIEADSTKIETIPHTRGRDILKPYITPFVLATFIILVYMAFRYKKIGSIKTILKTLGMVILMQAVLFSIIAIARIPIGRVTIPLVLGVYLLTLIGLTTTFEKQLKTKVSEEEKNNKKK